MTINACTPYQQGQSMLQLQVSIIAPDNVHGMGGPPSEVTLIVRPLVKPPDSPVEASHLPPLGPWRRNMCSIIAEIRGE
jgi:hypothetical protein